RSNPELSAQAAHLYLSAYLPAMVCLAATGLGVYRLARLMLLPSGRNPLSREAACWLIGALCTAHLGLVWGAMSGLELPLSTALAVWAIALLIEDERNERLGWSLALAALLPFARPDLVVIGLGGA